MTEIRQKIDSAEAIRAFQKAPEAMERNLDRFIGRGAEEIRGRAALNAQKRDWLAKLSTSIHTKRISATHYQVVTEANYARDVEEGTGPAAGMRRYFPNFENLVPYVKTSATRTEGERLKRAGSRGRFFQEREFVNRAFRLARYIYWHGTQPHPYMAPAAQEKESRVIELIREGTEAGIREAFAQ